MSARARNWMLIIVTVMFLIGFRAVTSQPLAPRPYFLTDQPMVIAHQGGDGLRPGNTMVAFHHAMHVGADVLEMDLHRSSDGELVLIHDARVDRTTDGSGAVRDMTYDELSRLDAAYRWPYTGEARPYRGHGVRIPRLAEVFRAFPGMRLNIEIKQEEPDLTQALCASLLEHGARDRVLVASFHRAAMISFREQCPGVATSAHRVEVAWFVAFHALRLTRLYRPVGVALQVPVERMGVDFTDPGLLADAVERGLHVDVWTVNRREEIARLFDLGVGGVITDFPDLAVELRDARSVAVR